MARLRRLPAEWEPQGAVQLTWPHPDGDWEDNLRPAQECFASIGAAISPDQLLLSVVHDPEHEAHVRSLLRQHGANPEHCLFATAPSEDSWARDHAALSVHENGHWRLLDFEFNGWGGRYPAEHDNALTRELARQGVFGDTAITRPGLTLEGGAIETDGEGCLLLRTPTLLDPRRNPGLDRQDLETALAEWLGAEHCMWLESGNLDGDDTDGHIDTLARFAPGGIILFQACNDPGDSHYVSLRAMAAELGSFTRAEGQAWQLMPLPLPAPVHDSAGRRMPAGYANFLVTNHRVLVPAYDDPADPIAVERIAQAFPDREVLSLDCRALVRQGGSLHCVTMQYPPGVVVPPGSGQA